MSSGGGNKESRRWDDKLVRGIAAVQAGRQVLEENEQLLTELSDLEALERFKNDLNQFILEHESIEYSE